jgi:hypothetical protein
MVPYADVRSLSIVRYEIIVLDIMNRKVHTPFLVLEHVASHLTVTL